MKHFSLFELADIKRGKSGKKVSHADENTVPCIYARNMVNGVLFNELGNKATINSQSEVRAHEGDILLSREYLKDVTPKPCVVTREYDGCCVNENLYVLSPKSGVDPQLIVAYLLSAEGRDKFESMVSKGTTKTLSIGALKTMDIKIPVSDEQKSNCIQTMNNKDALMRKFLLQMNRVNDNIASFVQNLFEGNHA